MKPDLTYEQCRDLEKWGLDQALREGDWAYVIDPRESKLILSLFTDRSRFDNYVKLPSAEEMMSFCQGEIERRWGGATLAIRYFIDDDGTRCWAVGVLGKKPEYKIILEPMRRDEIGQALYALCEKVFGEKEQQ